MIRMLVLEDLRVVRGLCVPCFPPHYDIVNTFINMYHSALATHVSLGGYLKLFLSG